MFYRRKAEFYLRLWCYMSGKYNAVQCDTVRYAIQSSSYVRQIKYIKHYICNFKGTWNTYHQLKYILPSVIYDIIMYMFIIIKVRHTGISLLCFDVRTYFIFTDYACWRRTDLHGKSCTWHGCWNYKLHFWYSSLPNIPGNQRSHVRFLFKFYERLHGRAT